MLTHDLGYMIRDMIEDREFETGGDFDFIVNVDTSDPSNLIVVTESGKQFRVIILLEG